MSILQNLTTYKDLKNLSFGELDALSGELRSFLIENISKTGGHLASNLGAVELTVAIHRVFDTAYDRLIFDVGHQCYVHKILTGRRDRFNTLRTLGGISGFPKPDESVHDAFVAGHASTAVSVALGMARSRTLLNHAYSVIAMLGDGALTGGLAYEALNDAGQCGLPLIVILNDNGMSITQNVGGLSRHLAYLRTKPNYLRAKNTYRRILGRLPGGRSFYRFSHNVKTAVKDALLPGGFFESMGFSYLGPCDGHNIREICRLLEMARDMRKPTLIHLNTTKGKGYKYSEDDPPQYHGVAKFDIASGRSVSASVPTFSSVFGDALVELAGKNDRVCALTAAMQSGTGLDKFSQQFPERFFDVGIAEEHAVAMAGGMAKQGLVPVCAIYSTFLQRAYDMLIHDVALPGQHVVFAVDRAGITGEDGETHHGVFDVGFLCQIPGMQVLCPASFAELRTMLEYAVLDLTGPVAIRFPRGGEGAYRDNNPSTQTAVVRSGRDITIVSYGTLINNALEAHKILASKGISAEVLKLGGISPLQADIVLASLRKTRNLAVIEDCVLSGSVGERLASTVAQNGLAAGIKLFNIGSTFVPHGTVSQLQCKFGLDASTISSALHNMLRPNLSIVESAPYA